MTVSQQGGKDLAQADFFQDVTEGDLTVPRLGIDHQDAVFRNRQTQEEFAALDCIMLSVVKQRAMWPVELAEDNKGRPRCKSSNFAEGFPNEDESRPKDERFPWRESNFDPENFPAEKGVNGLVTLPCASCIFKEWDREANDGSRSWKQPPCNEQHTYPIIYTTDEWETSQPALITFARTGITPSKTYLSAYAQTKTPMFQYYTKITLEQKRRGTVMFCTPKFQRGKGTNPDDWQRYGELYFAIRELITRAPRNPSVSEEDEQVTMPANVNTPPAAEQSQTPSEETAADAPTRQAATSGAAASSEDDDDIPF